MDKRSRWQLLAAVVCGVAIAQLAGAEEQEQKEEELLLEGVVVEATFDLDLQLELPQASAVQIMIERLNLHAETLRKTDLEIANRTPLNTLLDLTKYSPIPIGGSGSKVDTFFLENHMRVDLNPRHEDPLGLDAD